jgi:hypothetical protein
MFVSCTVFVLSGRSLCDGPIPRPEESYRLWCVSECDQVTINNLDTCCEQVGRRGKRYEPMSNRIKDFVWLSNLLITSREIRILIVIIQKYKTVRRIILTSLIICVLM